MTMHGNTYRAELLLDQVAEKPPSSSHLREGAVTGHGAKEHEPENRETARAMLMRLVSQKES